MTTEIDSFVGSGGLHRPGAVEHQSMAERTARGKACREAVPRSSHGVWEPGPERRDPVDLLEGQAATRVPELVPIRYGRMLVSPFTFYRGAALLMASDLATMPRTDLHVQLCGDSHLANFGAFAAPDRRLVFSVNDFDETLPGPFEWDVRRLVASFAVAGRDRGFDNGVRESVNRSVARAYREAMKGFAAMRLLDVWYARLDLDDIGKQWAAQVNRKELKRLNRNVAKARAKDSLRALDKLTHVVDGHPRMVSDPPLIVPIDELFPPDRRDQFEDWIRSMLRAYGRHTVGGSSPVARAVPLCGRRSQGGRGGQRRHPGVDRAAHRQRRERSVDAPGQRGRGVSARAVPRRQRVRQPRPAGGRGPAAHASSQRHHARLAPRPGVDIEERDFYVRQLWDSKFSAEIETMDPRV